MDGGARSRLVLAGIALAIAAGCRVSATFNCETSNQCGLDGTCEPDGLCSFPDASCPSGARYGEYSGDLSGTCVSAATSVGFQFTASLTDELAGTHLVSVVLSAPVAEAVHVGLEVSGGSAGPDDATLLTSTMTFLPGETRHDAMVAIVDDGVAEPDETLELSLVDPMGADITGGPHVLTISATPLPRIQFEMTTSMAPEGAAGPRLFALVMDVPSTTDVVVGIGAAGTASPADYQPLPPTLIVPAGLTTAEIPATIIDDISDEYDETLDVTLTALVGVVVGAVSTHVHTVSDDDAPPQVRFEVATSMIDENGGPATVNVTLGAASGKNVTVDTMITGGTAAGSDYVLSGGAVIFPPGVTSRPITIAPTDDAIDEENETVVVQLVNASEATIMPPSSHTLAILDDDPAPPLAFTAATSMPSEGVGTYSVMVAKSAPSERVVTFNVASMPGTAGTMDFSVGSGPYTIPIGQTSVNVPVTITNDNFDEIDETFDLTLTNLVNAVPGSPITHTATIVDDDVGAHFTTPSMSAPEGTGGNSDDYFYTVSLTATSTQNLAVGVMVGGTASGSDRSVSPTNLVFSPGTLSRVVVVTIQRDNNNEQDETVILTLVAGPGVEIIAPSSVTHTIINDD